MTMIAASNDYCPPRSVPVRPPEMLRVAVLYCDEAAADAVKEIHRRVLSPVAMALSVHSREWAMNALASPRIFEESLLQAVRADLLILTVPAQGALPEEAAIWLKVVLAVGSEHERALAVLFTAESCAGAAHVALDASLQQEATRAGFVYLSGWYQPAARSASRFPGLALAASGPRNTAGRPASWGINE